MMCTEGARPSSPTSMRRSGSTVFVHHGVHRDTELGKATLRAAGALQFGGVVSVPIVAVGVIPVPVFVAAVGGFAGWSEAGGEALPVDDEAAAGGRVLLLPIDEQVEAGVVDV